MFAIGTKRRNNGEYPELEQESRLDRQSKEKNAIRDVKRFVYKKAIDNVEWARIRNSMTSMGRRRGNDAVGPRDHELLWRHDIGCVISPVICPS